MRNPELGSGLPEDFEATHSAERQPTECLGSVLFDRQPGEASDIPDRVPVIDETETAEGFATVVGCPSCSAKAIVLRDADWNVKHVAQPAFGSTLSDCPRS